MVRSTKTLVKMSKSAEASRPAGSARPERFIKLDEVKRRIGLGKSMVYRLIQEGKFPAPYKISSFASRWSDREVSDWIDDVKDGFEGPKRKV